MGNSFAPGLSIDRATWREILAAFMPSEIMRRHLENVAPTKEQLRDLICFAPVSIGKKLDWLQKLAKAESSDQSAFFAARAEELRQAVDALELKPGEVFHLRKLWYDAPNACVRENAGSGRLFKSLERAVGHIDFSLFTERLETPPGEDMLTWFVLEKWTPDQVREMKRVYRYYFIEKDVCFVRKEQGVPDRNDWHSDRHFMQNSVFGPRFRLPAPVLPGDVVLIDRRPFQPVVKAVILTAEDGGDGPTAFFQNARGQWTAESLQSFFFSSNSVEPWEPYQDTIHLFPLYGLRLPDGPLGEEDGMLKTVQDYIAGSEERGLEILEKLRRKKAKQKRGEPMRTQREIEEILNTFMPSPEMRSYLAGQALNEWALDTLIAGAPAALDSKARYACGEDRQIIQRALDELALRPGEIFTLNSAWYDEDLQGQKESFVGAYLSLEQLIRDIRKEDMDAPDSDRLYTIGDATEWCIWYQVDKWAPAGRSLEQTYTYTFLGEKPVWFRAWKTDGVPEERGYFRKQSELNVPTPFHVGEIVAIDCRPFAPPLHGLLLEEGDRPDCCLPSVLCFDGARWGTFALKHGVWHTNRVGEQDERPPLSALYRLALYDGALPPHEAALREVQALLDGDAERAERFWEAFNGLAAPGLGEDEKLVAMVRKLKGI